VIVMAHDFILSPKKACWVDAPYAVAPLTGIFRRA
jgi:hypothetical protein